jgi:predicted RNA binding protein YcfA (HicA-like mRNA interferase family)
MSHRLKRLSGRDVVQVLQQFGFVIHSQRGSHAKLRRVTPAGDKETLTVPLHDDVDMGTFAGNFQAAQSVYPRGAAQALFLPDSLGASVF